MSKRKLKNTPKQTEQDDHRPWPVHVVRWLSYAALATVLIADNVSPTVSSLSKISFFQLFTGLAIAAWLALAISNKNYRPNWKNPIVLGSTAFVLLTSLSLFTSVDPGRSFWSNAYRLTGTFNYLHYWLWMLALSSTHRGWSEWRPILWVSNSVAVIVDGYGISKWLLDDAGRIRSTIDNALYLADFALLSSFISAILIARSKSRTTKALAILSFIINVWATVLTGSRSTGGALAVGLAAIICWLVITKVPEKRRRIAIAGLAILMSGSIAALLFVRSDSGQAIANKLPSAVQRIALATDFGQDRAALAGISWRAFKEKPLLGWGSENFDVAFESNYGPVGIDSILPEAWYDRAHDQFIDVLVMNGLIGFIGYIAFWFLTIYLLLRRLIRSETANADANFISLAAIVCYGAALIFSFDLPGPMTWHWLILAYLAANEMRQLDPEKLTPKINNGLAYALLTVVLIMESALSVKPYLQARAMEQGCNISRSSPADALVHWRDALSSKTMATPELRFRLLGCIGDVISSQAPIEEKKSALEFANSQLDRAAEARPYDYKTLLAAGWIKMPIKALGINELDDAETYFRQAVEINPTKPRAYELMADLASQQGDNLLKAQLLLKAADLAGNTSEKAKFLARSATYFARSGQVHQAIVTYISSYRTDKNMALQNNASLPAISEVVTTNTEIPNELVTATEEAVDLYNNAAHHAARLRILLSADNVSEDQIDEAFAETKAAFPELAEMISGRLKN